MSLHPRYNKIREKQFGHGQHFYKGCLRHEISERRESYEHETPFRSFPDFAVLLRFHNGHILRNYVLLLVRILRGISQGRTTERTTKQRCYLKQKSNWIWDWNWCKENGWKHLNAENKRTATSSYGLYFVRAQWPVDYDHVSIDLPNNEFWGNNTGSIFCIKPRVTSRSKLRSTVILAFYAKWKNCNELLRPNYVLEFFACLFLFKHPLQILCPYNGNEA